jgi:hypothetical protein
MAAAPWPGSSARCGQQHVRGGQRVAMAESLPGALPVRDVPDGPESPRHGAVEVAEEWNRADRSGFPAISMTPLPSGGGHRQGRRRRGGRTHLHLPASASPGLLRQTVPARGRLRPMGRCLGVATGGRTGPRRGPRSPDQAPAFRRRASCTASSTASGRNGFIRLGALCSFKNDCVSGLRPSPVRKMKRPARPGWRRTASR